MNEKQRKIAIPGEVLSESTELLPGEGTIKQDNKIIALKYGLIEESRNLIKIISLSGPYTPRRGNVVIGKVENITFKGWIIDIRTAENAFLSLAEVPRYVNKNDLEEVMKIGDMMVGKIWSVNKRGMDLSLKSRGLGKIDKGIIVEINPNKVPRIIGKEGSMIKLINDETKCNITVGQNGLIWIKGEKIEDELFAKKAILFVVEKSFVSKLTKKIEKFFKEEGGSK